MPLRVRVVGHPRSGGRKPTVGGAITSVTHDQAEENGGGTYVIAYGPMIIGGIRFFQGLFGMMA